MKLKISKYWLCQIGGWSTYIIVWTFFYLTLRTQEQPNFFEVLMLDAVLGLATTHFMRFITRRLNLLKRSLDMQIISMFITTLVFSFVFGFASIFLENLFDLTPDQFKRFTIINQTLRASYGAFFFLIIWNLIYFTYHYIEKSRQEQLDKIRLQTLVKELELKTIKSHINPHFIFNALNSIRALVDENPERARQAITELSNILRSSMKAEKLETASLEKELGIVKDYLALEHIRFEDRLRVEYEVDEDTLDQPVPPMMLQTLVENAIKHGISKRIEGGVIRIISDFVGDQHELIVQNTGHLNGATNTDGFGLYSTQNRLMLMYGEKAHFQIKDKNDMVEAKITMPATLN